jgi:hypothetical protein
MTGERNMHGREQKYSVKILVGIPEGKKLFGISKHRWEDNIKMDIEETGCIVNLLHLDNDRDQWHVVHKVLNIQLSKMRKIFLLLKNLFLFYVFIFYLTTLSAAEII